MPQTRSSLRALAHREHTLTSEILPVEHNKSVSALGYPSLFNVQQGQLRRNAGRPQRTTSVDHNSYLSPPQQPSLIQTIVDLLKEHGLSVVPFFYVFSRDRLAWVTLNGPEPLLDVVLPLASRINFPRTAGQFDWEWSINADFYDPRAPWRPYIPVQNHWLREGTQGWVFRTLPPDQITESSTPYLLLPALKKDIRLTFQAIIHIYNSVNAMYSLSMCPLRLDLCIGDWMDWEYRDIPSLVTEVWNARRVILDLYGWVSYHLLHDTDWAHRPWDDKFLTLVQRMTFVSAPKKGVVVNPNSVSLALVITLVQHDVPVHYQWKARNGVPPVDPWRDPVGQACYFDPYLFRCYDWAAFKQAGVYSHNALDRAILGHDSASSLSESYHRKPVLKMKLYCLPSPRPRSQRCKKSQQRYFVRDYVGAELIEVSKDTIEELKKIEDGAFLETRKHPTGDMYLLTKHYTRSHNPMMFLDDLFEEAGPVRLSPTTHLLLTQDVPMRTEAPVAEPLGNSSVKDTLAFSVATKVVEDFAMQTEAESLSVRASLQFMVESSDDTLVLTETILRSSDLGSMNKQPSLVVSPPEPPCQNQFDIPSVQAATNLSVAAEGDRYITEETVARSDAMDGDLEETVSSGDSKEPFAFDVDMSLPHPASTGSPPSPQPSSLTPFRRSLSPLRGYDSPVRATSGLQRHPQSIREPTLRSWSVDQAQNSSGHNDGRELPTTTMRQLSYPQSCVQRAVVSECSSDLAASSSTLVGCQDAIGRRAHITDQLPASASALPPPSIDLIAPLKVQRDSAIAFVLSSFSPSATNTQFNGPEVCIGNVNPPTLPGSVRQECRLGISAATELRLRYWHLCEPQVSLFTLLSRCVAKGLPYRIYMPSASIRTVNRVMHNYDPGISSVYYLIHQERGEKVSERMVKQYYDNVREVLGRPHARRYLGCGGLLWRITREYSPDLYTDALLGPSITATLCGRAEMNEDSTYYTDKVMDEEVKMLLGFTSNSNSFWPLPEWYEHSSRYNGEWTAANEAWFVQQAARIRMGREGCLRSGRFWQTNIRKYSFEVLSNPATEGTTAHAVACCSHLSLQWTDIWDHWQTFNLIHI